MENEKQTLEEEVNQPKHYKTHESGIEAIEITRWLPADLSNAWKYAMRYQDKGTPKKDLKKMIWYLRDFISHFTDRFGRTIIEIRIPDEIMNQMFNVEISEPVKEISSVFREIYSICLNNSIVSMDELDKTIEDLEKYLETFSN